MSKNATSVLKILAKIQNICYTRKKKRIGRALQMRKPYVTWKLVVLRAVENDAVRTSVVLADTVVMGLDNAGYWDEAW